MAFVLDSNPASATMNSYVSRSEADDYFAGNFSASAAWAALEPEQKDAALRQATLWLETLVYGGLKTSTAQPLQQPRKEIYDREGTLYPNNVVIDKVKFAACELAYWIISEGDRLLSDTEIMQFDSYQLGPINVKKDVSYDVFPKAVNDLLKSVGPGFVQDPTKGRVYKYARM